MSLAPVAWPGWWPLNVGPAVLGTTLCSPGLAGPRVLPTPCSGRWEGAEAIPASWAPSLPCPAGAFLLPQSPPGTCGRVWGRLPPHVQGPGRCSPRAWQAPVRMPGHFSGVRAHSTGAGHTAQVGASVLRLQVAGRPWSGGEGLAWLVGQWRPLSSSTLPKVYWPGHGAHVHGVLVCPATGLGTSSLAAWCPLQPRRGRLAFCGSRRSPAPIVLGCGPCSHPVG